MAIARLQRAFPSSYAGYRVSIRDSASGQPARLYASILGGLVTATGNTVVNSAGQLDTFLDGSRQYNLTIYDPRGRKVDTDLGVAVDPDTNQTSSTASLGSSLVAGTWYRAPSLFRLSLTGTGTLILAARNLLGVVTADVYTTTVSAVANQIEYPFLGSDATELRATFPGTLSVTLL